MDSGTTGSEEAEITRLIEDWARAVRHRDFTGILANHSADILMFDVPPPVQSKGIDAYRSTWDLFFSWSPDPVVFDILEMSVTAGNDVAFVTAIMRCAGTPTAGENSQLTFRLTVGLRKVDRQWVIAHEHHSFPSNS
jgi:uncharacterized protein (TIGR02246 family)